MAKSPQVCILNAMSTYAQANGVEARLLCPHHDPPPGGVSFNSFADRTLDNPA